MLDTIELKDREVVNLPLNTHVPIRHFGVALDNEEAQDFVDQGLRVFGDDKGPYLVVRLKATMPWPIVWNRDRVDVVVNPQSWIFHEHQGVICWLESVI